MNATPNAPAGTTDDEAAPTPAKPTNPYATMLAIMGGGLAMAFVIIAFGIVAGGGDEAGGDAAAAAPVAVTLSEFAIDGDLRTAPGGTLAVTNAGSQVHNLVIEDGASTSELASGAAEDLAVAEGVEIAAAAEGDSGDAASGGGAHDHTDLTPEKAAELDEAMMSSFEPFVEQIETGELNTEGLGGQDLEPTIGADGVKEWTLTAAITPWEPEPGKVVDAWT